MLLIRSLYFADLRPVSDLLASPQTHTLSPTILISSFMYLIYWHLPPNTHLFTPILITSILYLIYGTAPPNTHTHPFTPNFDHLYPVSDLLASPPQTHTLWPPILTTFVMYVITTDKKPYIKTQNQFLSLFCSMYNIYFCD